MFAEHNFFEYLNNIEEKSNGNRTNYIKYASGWDAPYGRDNTESLGQDGGDKESKSGIVEK